MYKKRIVSFFLVTIFLAGINNTYGQADKCLVDERIRDEIVMEISGEKALEHIINLAGWPKNRDAEEYEGTFFETDYIIKQGKKFGLEDIHAEFFERGEVWDAETGDLYIKIPYEDKIASINSIPACLARHSRSANFDEAELVYIGEGVSPKIYKDTDVKGKVVLASGSAPSVHFQAVLKNKALGVITKGSYPIGGDYPLENPNQVGWTRISNTDSSGFAFILTEKQWNRLYNAVMSLRKVKVGVNIKTRYFPFKVNVISATIPGTEYPEQEMVNVAHIFEGIDKQGANDNASGAAALLEIARTLNKLIKDGKIPPLKRTVRFLWVDEFIGTIPYLRAHPELWDRIICALNFDMAGEDLYKCDSYLRMKMPPDSRAGFLTDIIANLLEFVDRSDIRTPTGNNGPFNYRLVPFIGASDHVLFIQNPIGVQAMQFNHWTDNYYHTNEDRPDKSDPTELKRVCIIATCAYYYIANASKNEARETAWEISCRGAQRLEEVTRQSINLLNDKNNINIRYKSAINKIEQNFIKEKKSIESVSLFSEDEDIMNFVKSLVAGLEKQMNTDIEKLKRYYETLTGKNAPEITLTKDEKKYRHIVPRYVIKNYTEEYDKANDKMQKDWGQYLRLYGDVAFEVRNFIDGERSILDIYKAVDSEFGGVVQGYRRTEHKFQYAISPAFRQIKLKDVADYITAMEKAGIVKFK